MGFMTKWKTIILRLVFSILLVNSTLSFSQFELGDEPGYGGFNHKPMVGGTLWQGSLPTGSSSNPGRPGMFKLMWNSKVTRVDMIGQAQATIGPAKAGAEVWKTYDVEKKTFKDATLKTNFSIGVGMAKTEIRTVGKLKDPMKSKVTGYGGIKQGGVEAGLRTDFKGKVTAEAKAGAGPIKIKYKEIVAKPKSDGSFTNVDGKKTHVASGTSLIDSLFGVFGSNWHTHVAENTTISYEDKIGSNTVKLQDAENYQLGGTIGGIGLKVGKSKGNETFWAGTGNAQVGYVRKKDDSTKVSMRASTFLMPNVKAGGGVDLYMVPMTPEEIKIRNENLSKNLQNNYSSSMAENMGFVTWQESDV